MKKVFIISALTLMSVAMFGQAEEIAKAYAKEQIKVWVNDRDVKRFFEKSDVTPNYLYSVIENDAVHGECLSKQKRVVEINENDDAKITTEKYINYSHIVSFSNYVEKCYNRGINLPDIYISVYLNDNMEVQGIEMRVSGYKGYYKAENTFGKYYNISDGIQFTTKAETSELSAEYDEEGDWFTLSGEYLSEKPTTSGVYVHNGRRTIIKK